MNQQSNWNRKKIMFIPLFIAGFFIMIWVVMYIWNAILPDVIGVKSISYWQALGLFILSKILFSGFGNGGKMGNNQWKKSIKMKTDFMNMTDDEKELFKQEWRERCK